ncbi:hypothetical protein [Chroogloeocystis siderophila]|jgi:hypothetical protein|uniref:hypothetical protein n=1 Tax=Chroogloeocystis siderophila TaxID=329163 RepID=UPI001C4A1737|nr:hypothetical protein [Chroogloeocystis siderophila]
MCLLILSIPQNLNDFGQLNEYSITQWLAVIVGSDGKVTAVDVDPRFMANIQRSNVEVIKADIRHCY